MKVCVRCKIEKDESFFPLSNQQRSGLFPYCRQCCSEKRVEYTRKKGIQPRVKRTKDELPEHKICTRCKILKPRSEFRDKLENGKYWTLVPSCNKCSAEIAKIYYDKHKHDEEFKKKNRERSLSYKDKNIDKIKLRQSTKEYIKNHAAWNKLSYHRRKDYVSLKQKEKRQTEKYKKYVKDYYQANRNKILKQHKIVSDKYNKKLMEENPLEYAKRQIRSQTGCENPPQELIEAKNLIIQIKRKIKNYDN